MPPHASQTVHRLHRAGIIIIALGWIAAVLIFLLAGSDDDSPEGGDYTLINGQTYSTPLAASKRELQQVERLGGKATVGIVEFDSWLGSLWHGQRLAWTLGLLSTVVGGACIWLAGLAAEDAGDS